MAKLSLIDATMPFVLDPYTRARFEDAEMEELAKSMQMPQLLNVDRPTVDAEPLSIDVASSFIDWLMSSHWGRRIERDLQSLSKDREGRPLLSSWLTTSEFAWLVRDAQDGPFGPCLQQSYDTWVALGVDTVYFKGYELVQTIQCSHADSRCPPQERLP